MRRPFFSSLRVRLLGLVFLALIPAAGVIIYSGLDRRATAHDQVEDNTLALTELTASQHEQLIEGSRQLLASLAILTSGANLRDIDQAACSAFLQGLLAQFSTYSNLGFMGSDGFITCSALPTTGAPVYAGDRTYFKLAMATGEFALGDHQIGRISGREVVTFAYPIVSPEGERNGIVFLAIDLERLAGLLPADQLPEGATFTLTDRNGTILVRTPDDGGDWVGQTLPPSASLDETTAGPDDGRVQEIVDIDGVERLTAAAAVGDAANIGLRASVGIPPQVAFAATNYALYRNLIALGVVGVLALLAAWFGGDAFLLRRLRELVNATERVRDGDLSARSGQAHDRSELGVLANGFDTMAEAIEKREAERDSALAELGRRNDELEAFTYSVSHDLKEPLRTLRTFSEFMLQDYGTIVDDDGKEYLEGIGAASVRMARLIDELLVLSRLSREAPLARVDMNEVAGETIESLRGAIEARNATVRIQPNLPDVLAHRPRVEQILSNLISNAVKFNEGEKPLVEVGSLGSKDDVVTFVVKDNGVGIDPEFHEVVFGLFQRLNRREEFEGTGAGLAIAKRAAEVSGGAMWVESTPGAGSTFYFSLQAWTPVRAALRNAA